MCDDSERYSNTISFPLLFDLNRKNDPGAKLFDCPYIHVDIIGMSFSEAERVALVLKIDELSVESTITIVTEKSSKEKTFERDPLFTRVEVPLGNLVFLSTILTWQIFYENGLL